VLIQVQCNNDPLKVKAQNVLGQFEEAKSLVNTPSALGVILMPVTPALVPKDTPLLPNTSNHVDSSGRPSAFKALPSVKSHAGRKTSEGIGLLNRCISCAKLYLITECNKMTCTSAVSPGH